MGRKTARFPGGVPPWVSRDLRAEAERRRGDGQQVDIPVPPISV